MNFCGTTDCDALLEKFSTEVAVEDGTSLATSLIEQASGWVYATLSAFNYVPSIAMPSSGTSPNWWIKRAAASEAVYLGLARRMIASNESTEGYFNIFHEDATAILNDIRNNKIVIEPDIAPGFQGIGQPYGIANGTITAPANDLLESNARIAGNYYEDDYYPRSYIIEMTSGSTYKYWIKNEPTEIYTGTCDWQFINLGYGVAIRFAQYGYGTYTTGKQWQLDCYPEKEIKSKKTCQTQFLQRA